MAAWHNAAEGALGKARAISSSKHFGRAKGCKEQLVPRGQELHRKANLTMQLWLSLRRWVVQCMRFNVKE
eukprot:4626134-Pyramimonas_sp.AAC.1